MVYVLQCLLSFTQHISFFFFLSVLRSGSQSVIWDPPSLPDPSKVSEIKMIFIITLNCCLPFPLCFSHERAGDFPEAV